MATIIDRAYLAINGDVVECSSIEPKVSGNKKPVKVMNRKNRPIGHARGVPEFTLSVELPMDADLEVNFKQMLLDGDQFSTVVEYEDGKEETYTDCQIYDVDESAKEGDEATVKLEIGALDLVQG